MSQHVKASLLVVSILLGLYVLFLVRDLALIALIGVGLGVLLTPMLEFLRTHLNVPRGLSAALFVILLFALIGLAATTFYFLALEQVKAFAASVPGIIDNAHDRTTEFLKGQVWIQSRLKDFNLGSSVKAFASQAISGVQTVSGTLVGLFLLLAIGIFTALRSSENFAGFLSLFPAWSRPRVSDVLLNAASALRRWFGSQLTVILLTGALTAIGLWIIGIDYWLVLGIATALFGFIPYVGAFISGALTALVALGSDPQKIWWVLALYVGLQQIEAQITAPIVMREQNKLPQVPLIIAVAVMSSLFGVPGAFIATPLFSVIHSIYLTTYLPLMNSKTTKNGDGGKAK